MFVAGLGVPRDVITLCHEHNVLVREHVRQGAPRDRGGRGRLRHRRRAGHRSRRSHRHVATLPLVPQVVDAVGDRVPVVAAGGIFDGRGLAAALALGADGVWVGTRFIATPEARSAPGYKDALLRTAEDGTVDHARRSRGKPLRTVRNEWTRALSRQHPEELAPFPEQLMVAVQGGGCTSAPTSTATGVDPDRECYPGGQGVGGIDELVPAGELVRRFVTEAEQALRAVDAGRSR